MSNIAASTTEGQLWYSNDPHRLVGTQEAGSVMGANRILLSAARMKQASMSLKVERLILELVKTYSKSEVQSLLAMHVSWIVKFIVRSQPYQYLAKDLLD